MKKRLFAEQRNIPAAQLKGGPFARLSRAHRLMKNVTEDYPPMTREAPPNLIGGVYGGTDQYGS
jgi:hypothetical protein